MAFRAQEFHMCKIPSFVVKIHESINGKTLFDDYYLYIGFSVDELAILAKKSKDALLALESRLKDVLQEIETRYCHRLDCMPMMLHTKLEECVAASVRKYDPEKGPFLHLLRAVSKRGMERFSALFRNRRKKILRYLPEYQYPSEDIVYLKDSIQPKDREKRFELDFRGYVEQLTKKERIILQMYESNFSYREIGNRVGLSTSAVSNKVHQMLAEIRNRMKKKLL